VVNLPDARKGERLLLLTTNKTATVPAILSAARARGIPEIMVPREAMIVETMPLLGTGKLDYPAIQKLAEARTATPDSESNVEESEPILS
jgi:acyl-[acyl-carrier-protein]-phospholipid O-acyltransferase/long-chain-fatty-acid--[acyl-carrier-protein] ligase